MSKRKSITALLMVVLLIAWVILNPPGRFGWCRYALTTYNVLPRPVADIQVRADGKTRKVSKTHDLDLDTIRWLLEPRPEVLIIAIGWDGVVRPRQEIENLKDCELHILKNAEAKKLFNQLKNAKRRVAIHFHSTC